MHCSAVLLQVCCLGQVPLRAFTREGRLWGATRRMHNPTHTSGVFLQMKGQCAMLVNDWPGRWQL